MFICLNISKKNQLVTNDEFLEQSGLLKSSDNSQVCILSFN